MCSCVSHGAATIWVITAQAGHRADQRVRGSATQTERPRPQPQVLARAAQASRGGQDAEECEGAKHETVTFCKSTGRAEPVSRACAMLFARDGRCILPP